MVNVNMGTHHKREQDGVRGCFRLSVKDLDARAKETSRHGKIQKIQKISAGRDMASAKRLKQEGECRV